MTAVTGIDLSLASTGVCVADPLVGIEPTVYRIQSKGKEEDGVTERCDRIVDIAERVLRVVPRGALVVIEAPSLGQARQAGEHQRAGLWWWLVTTLDLQGHRVLAVPPATLKKYATGSGKAGKDEVLAAAVRRYPRVNITGNDVADATVLAAIGLRLEGEPLEESLPAAQIAAIDKLAVRA